MSAGTSSERAEVDIGPHSRPGEVFHFVRLTDDRAGCSDEWPARRWLRWAPWAERCSFLGR